MFFYLLAKQRKINYIPKIIHYDCNRLTIKTENVGISLQEYCDEYGCDFEKNFIPKIKKIYNKFSKLGYYHNDLRLKNIVVNPKTQKIYLIDFEFTDKEYKDADDESIVRNLKRNFRNKSKRKIKSKRKMKSKSR